MVGQEESSAIRNRLVRAGGGLLGLRVFFSALSFTSTVLLARLLGNEGYGLYSYVLSWTVLFTVPAVFGMDQLLVREVAAFHAKKEWGRLRALLQQATLTVLLTSVISATLVGALAWLLGQHNSAALATFWIAAPLVPLVALTRVRQAVMQGLHEVARGSFPEQVVQPGIMLAVLAGLYAGRASLTAPGAMAAGLASAAVAFAVGVLLSARTLPAAVRTAPHRKNELSLTSSALPMFMITGVAVLFGQADTLILGALKGTVPVGIYTVAHKGAEFISIPLTILNASFASTIASLYALGDRARLQRLVTRLSRWTLLASLPAGIGLIVFGKWFLRLYGPQFAMAQTSLKILAVGQLFNVGLGPVGTLLVMMGRERDAIVAIGAGALANIALTLTLAPRWGAEGAAVAYSLGMIFWNIWAVVVLWRRMIIDSTALGRFSS